MVVGKGCAPRPLVVINPLWPLVANLVFRNYIVVFVVLYPFQNVECLIAQQFFDSRVFSDECFKFIAVDNSFISDGCLVFPYKICKRLDFVAIQSSAVTRFLAKELLREKDVHFVDQQYPWLVDFRNSLLINPVFLGLSEQHNIDIFIVVGGGGVRVISLHQIFVRSVLNLA